MSELKKCLHCDGKAVLAINDDHASEIFIYCKECGISTDTYMVTDKEDAIAAWNRRVQPDNEPLTLEELWGMDGEPVWVTHSDGSGGRWGIVNSYNHGLCADVGSGMAYWFDDYIGNVAYRRKPEGGDR